MGPMNETLNLTFYFSLTVCDKWLLWGSVDPHSAQHTAPGRKHVTVRNFYNLALDAAEQGLKPFPNVLASTVGMHRVTPDPSTLEACSPKSTQPRVELAHVGSLQEHR